MLNKFPHTPGLLGTGRWALSGPTQLVSAPHPPGLPGAGRWALSGPRVLGLDSKRVEETFLPWTTEIQTDPQMFFDSFK